MFVKTLTFALFSCSWFQLFTHVDSLDGDNVECWTPDECSNQTITVSAELSIMASFGAAFSEINATGAIFGAGASFSCFKAKKVTVTNGFIRCYGLYSCAMIDDMFVSDVAAIACHGELSCYKSNITVENDGTTIECYGDKSCSEAVIQGEYDLVEVTGRLGALNAVFMTESHNVDFEFLAGLSEYNATIICGYNCTVYCMTSKCNSLNYECSDDNPDCNIAFDYYSLLSSVSGDKVTYPIYDNLSLYYENDDIDNDDNPYFFQISTIENSLNLCNQDSSIFCENGYDCGKYYPSWWNNSTYSNDDYTLIQPPILTSSNGTICCSGSDSCEDLDNITNYESGTDGAIRCDGATSCQNEESRQDILTTFEDGANIYLSGTKPGIYTGVTKGNYSSKLGNIYASGAYGITDDEHIRLIDSKNVYCTGDIACGSSTISDISSNVYLYGYEHDSLSVENVGGTVYCSTYNGCAQYITNASRVIGIGSLALTGTDIENVPRIITYGYSTLSGLTVTSNIANENSDGERILNLVLYSVLNDFTLECTSDDTCIIDCIGYESCSRSEFICNGYCIMDCADGIWFSILYFLFIFLHNAYVLYLFFPLSLFLFFTVLQKITILIIAWCVA